MLKKLLLAHLWCKLTKDLSEELRVLGVAADASVTAWDGLHGYC